MIQKLLMVASLIPVIILAVLLSKRINLHFNHDIDEARGESSEKNLKKLRKSYHDRFIDKYGKYNKINSLFRFYDNWLIKSGNPLKLNAFSYFTIKAAIIAAFTFFFILYYDYGAFLLILFILSYFLINIMYIASNAEDEAQIKTDLPRVYNILETETYADIPIDRALMETYVVIKNKRLKAAFLDLSADILTNRNIPEALDKMRDKFYSRELYSFCLTIEQGIKTGKIRDMLSNQRKILNKTYLNNKDLETGKNEFKVVFAMILLFLSMGSIIIYNYVDYIYSKIGFLIK